MSSKGQIAIPQGVRDAVGLRAKNKQTENPFTSLWGLLADGRRTDDVMKELRPQRAWEDE